MTRPRWLAAAAAAISLALGTLVAAAGPASATDYAYPYLSMDMSCKVGQVWFGQLQMSTGDTEDGFQDWAILHFEHNSNDGKGWVWDGWSNYMYDLDTPELDPNSGYAYVGHAQSQIWYDQFTHQPEGVIKQSYAPGTFVAAQILFWSGDTRTWRYYSYATATAGLRQYFSCEVFDLFCAAYQCYPVLPNSTMAAASSTGRPPGPTTHGRPGQDPPPTLDTTLSDDPPPPPSG